MSKRYKPAVTDEEIAERGALLARARERYPAAFGDEPRPLAIGIDKILRDALGASNATVSRLLTWWCMRPEYISALTAPGSQRYNLDGTIAGDVIPEHREAVRKPRQPRQNQPQEERVTMSATVTGKSLKATVVLDASEIARLKVGANVSRVALRVEVSGRTVTADLNAKAVRKCIAAIDAAGEVGANVILQGKLEGAAITEAGLIAQPKTPKPAATPAASTEGPRT